MSTKLTKNDVPMVDSWTLKLVQNASKLHDLTTRRLCSELMEKGYVITPASLSFLGTLECGVNYASEIARKLGVSRQMVAKTVKELCNKGYLEQIEGVGKQKEILFTKLGESLISDSRKILADIDATLVNKLKKGSIETTLKTMELVQKELS